MKPAVTGIHKSIAAVKASLAVVEQICFAVRGKNTGSGRARSFQRKKKR